MKLLFSLFLLTLFVVPASAAKIKTTAELIEAMHKKYDGKWYKTLTFAQNTTTFKPDGTSEKSVWYETMSLPGRLRIDFERIGSGNGAIFVNGTQHDFKGGKVIGSRRTGHLLLLLGFDVYGQPALATLKTLEDLKFDLSKFREDVWQGRDVYVVGAEKGDSRSRQFWIDKKNLYFLRSIQPVGKDGARSQEIQFNDYRRVKGGGWIAARVDFFVDGKLVFLEEYFDIKPNVKLAEGIFDPQNLNITSYTPPAENE
jgi:outer membrane lipoprotein-sorting protein